jgi:ribosomal protein L24E
MAELEPCAYRQCKGRGVFIRRNGEQQRFCSEQCQQAYAYDVRRAELGVKTPRKRRLGRGIADARENGHFSSTKTVDCKRPQPSDFSTPLDLLGRGHRWPGTRSLDRETWQKIMWREVGP